MAATAIPPIAQLEAQGTVLEAAGRPFPLHDRQACWFVKSGTLDLFVAPAESDGTYGRRHPVLRTHEGQAAFGIEPPSHTVGERAWRLIGVPGPDTIILAVPLAQVMTAGDAGRKLLEGWIDRLAAVLSEDRPPKGLIRLSAAPGRIRAGEQAKNVTAEDGLLWMRPARGTARFFSKAELPGGDSAQPLPVPRNAWVEIEPGGEVGVLDSPGDDAFLAGIDYFHGFFFDCLMERCAASEAAACARQEARWDADAAGVSSSFRRLSAPISREQPLIPDDEHLNDPLFLAAQAVGLAVGIRMRPHPDMYRGKVLRDPVPVLARASGVRYRRVVLKDRWWKKEHGPLLAFHQGDVTPRALLTRHGRGPYEIYDPKAGTRTRLTEAEAIELSPVAYMFYRPFPQKALGVADLLLFGFHGCGRELTSMVLVGLVTGLLASLNPMLTGIIFDSVIPGAQRSQLLYISAFLVVSAVGAALFELVRGYAVLRLEGKMETSLQSAMWDRLLDMPVPFFREYSSGDLAIRSMGISQIRQSLTGPALTAILAGLFSFFSYGLLFYYSWRLALIASLLIAAAAIVSAGCGYFQVRYQRGVSEARGRIASRVLQFVGGIAKLRVSGTETRAFGNWARDFAAQKEIAARSRSLSSRLTIFNVVYPVIGSGCIFGAVAYYMTIPEVPKLTTGEFVAFYAAFLQTLNSVLQLAFALVSVINVVPLYERAAPILRTLPEVDKAKSHPGDLTGRLEINHLAFRYRADAPLVLRDVSLRVEPGQFVAIVGSSGSGKSTLMRLLLGFEKPDSGSVYYDGQDLANLDVQALRQQLGVVLQGGKLLSGDIFTNIVGAAPLTIEDAWEAARLAGLDQDIQSMPMGMHTMISEGGGTLSGGQRQRLLIARAIVNKPRIILFDEATSALDNNTQAIVSHSLEKLNATRIVIAHRLSTISKADRIFVLDKGLVVQSGAFEELVHQPGVFHELANRQLL